MKIYSLVNSKSLPVSDIHERRCGDSKVSCTLHEPPSSAGQTLVVLRSGFEQWSYCFVAEKGIFLRYISCATATWWDTIPTDKAVILEADDRLIEHQIITERNNERSPLYHALWDPVGSGAVMEHKLQALGDTPALKLWRKAMNGNHDAHKEFLTRIKGEIIR